MLGSLFMSLTLIASRYGCINFDLYIVTLSGEEVNYFLLNVRKWSIKVSATTVFDGENSNRFVR